MKQLKRWVIVLMLAAIAALLTACNYTYFDTTWKFDRAQIRMMDGSVIEGKVESWKDFEDGDQLQLTMNGVTYLTHANNVVMMSE